jgi:hypothetical protein
MNTPGLFIVGAAVTLIVVAAIAILIYGAVLDGREARRDRERDQARQRAEAADAIEGGTR